MNRPPSASNVFRFATVRAVEKHPIDATQRRFFRHEERPAAGTQGGESSLYSELTAFLQRERSKNGPRRDTNSAPKALLPGGGANLGNPLTLPGPQVQDAQPPPIEAEDDDDRGLRDRMIRTVLPQFTRSQHFIRSVEDLYSARWFGGYNRIDEWLRGNDGRTVNDLIAHAEATLQRRLLDHVPQVRERRLRLWDNLFYHALAGSTSALRDEIVRVLRIGWILERAAPEVDRLLVQPGGLREALWATPLLPAVLFSPRFALARSKDPEALEHRPVMTEPGAIIRIGNRFFARDQLCAPPPSEDPCAPYEPGELPAGAGMVQQIGVADLKIVQTRLLRYSTGEVAHIENILQGETKSRVFRTLRRSESVLQTEEETETESEKETQTTERFGLERESQSVLKEDMNLQFGLQISANMGTVQLGTQAGFALARSKEESNRVSTKFAREVTEKARSRVVERVRKQSTITTIVETEDTNTHTLENASEKATNIAGVYRWVDKYYLAQVVNYGKRLMCEFLVPEPAAFFIHASANPPRLGEAVAKPQPPEVPIMANKLLQPLGRPRQGDPKGLDAPVAKIGTRLIAPGDITEKNYLEWAARYGAQDVKPPPPPHQSRALSLVGPGGEGKPVDGGKPTLQVAHNEKLQVPDGYAAKQAAITIQWDDEIPGAYLALLIGNERVIPRAQSRDGAFSWISAVLELKNVKADNDDQIGRTPADVVPIALIANTVWYICNIEVVFQRSEAAFQKWQIEAYGAIVTAYERRLAEYRDWLSAQSVQEGVAIRGRNPAANRFTEKEELKKSCLELLTAQRFEAFGSMQTGTRPHGYPEFSFAGAQEQGAYIAFFEQLFDWEQMTYVFYPYFWGRKSNWLRAHQLDDPDPVFAKFLQAGAARVVVPVRTNLEPAALHYLATGQLWSGADVPAPDDPMYVSILDEIKEASGQFKSAQEEGEPWEIKLPTSLVILDPPGDKYLPDFGEQLGWPPAQK